MIHMFFPIYMLEHQILKCMWDVAKIFLVQLK